MINKQSSEQGFTLVELLATLALLSVVVVLAGSIHIFGQKQFVEQTNQVERINDVRLIMISIEKDVRKSTPDNISSNENNNQIMIGEIVYTLDGSLLKRNGELLSDQIRQFDANVKEDHIDLSLSTTASENSSAETVSTTIYFRR